MIALRELRDRTFSFNTHNRAVWVARAAAALPPQARVLDVGAGRGQYRDLFRHCSYHAHDFGQAPDTLGEYTRLDYESDITAISVEDGSFDAVLCTEVLEHVPDPVAAVGEMARILRPGGVLLLSAPLGSHLHQEPFHFFGGYTPHWYQRVLGQAGFEITSIERNGGFFSFFGQELLRFHQYVDPRYATTVSWPARLALTVLWVVSWPASRLVPVLALWLDRLGLENTATVGYHVSAYKRS